MQTMKTGKWRLHFSIGELIGMSLCTGILLWANLSSKPLLVTFQDFTAYDNAIPPGGYPQRIESVQLIGWPFVISGTTHSTIVVLADLAIALAILFVHVLLSRAYVRTEKAESTNGRAVAGILINGFLYSILLFIIVATKGFNGG